MAGIFGIAKRGFGKAVKSYKQKKIAAGKATREERIKSVSYTHLTLPTKA